MLEIMLMGIGVVAIYLISHALVTAVERRRGQPLGAWRTPVFFISFLAMLLVMMAGMEWLLGSGG